ncbi:fumarylacetoacetate hydrolase family protein [Desertibacillus haloalkaliphilus]|uniref:fumarylacetoacetate hydrolase family protein n=1 Tax=Desertibacillus haloalkaliphilus TaxID=1328930 RepID=UPI001C25D2C3|nr:fumarylacetoacetate hydrolase family protein [Desertibacillus haloalkaliphilus]MBU8907624.1 fumarylacetoacetate hydrolase family protein [Desertibacillus haloalkaliphilus]
MKLVTYKQSNGEQRAGCIVDDKVVDLEQSSSGRLPKTLLEFIQHHEVYEPIAKEMIEAGKFRDSIDISDIELLTPLPNAPSVRDFMAFEEHIVNATKRSNLTVAPEWYEIPAFYFTNHLVLRGNNQPITRPPACQMLDYELEIACIIGKEGINIKAEDAEEYIFGYAILNDWSARDLQMKEMKVGLGPAKGKDFATSVGPYLVTKDELETYRKGDRFNLEMTAKVNEKLLSKGNAESIYYTFHEMIERASAGVPLQPGEIIGSGTVGTGCILELGPEVHRWLKPGDEVKLEVDGLGTLINKINE